jgi:opacity protein-like surface antigen
VAPVMHDWSGPYAGVNVGYAFGNTVQYDDTSFDSGDQDISGIIGGGQIGANFQMESFVLGVETDMQFSGIEGDFQTVPDEWECVKDNGCSTEVGWFGSSRLRLGYAVDSVMPYVTGGVAYGSVESEIKGDSDFNLDETQVGWTAGGGLEAALAEHFTARVEYIYVDLGETDETGPKDFSASANFSVIRAGLNYTF